MLDATHVGKGLKKKKIQKTKNQNPKHSLVLQAGFKLSQWG